MSDIADVPPAVVGRLRVICGELPEAYEEPAWIEDLASFVGEAARIAGLSVAGRDYLAGRHRALAGQCGCDEGLRQQDGLVQRRIARSPSIAGTRLHSVRVSASSTVRSRTAYR
jgi:hypothetical protein